MRFSSYSNHYDYDPGEDMSYVSSHCSRFSRRHDVDMFNMTDYQSCENCRHMAADNQCILKMQERFTSRHG